jgi:hypothetical protein
VHSVRRLRRIFDPRRAGVIRGWRKVHDEELRSLYFWSSIIRMMKSWSVRWAGNGGEAECV